MWMGVSSALCVCASCVWTAQGGQKRAADPLGLELRVAMSHQVKQVSVSAQTWVLCGSSQGP